MNREELLDKLDALNKDRQWLASATGYEVATVMNKLGPSGKISSRMMEAFERALLEEERRSKVELTDETSAWDLVYFSGIEVSQINLARKAGGYDNIPAFYRDAVISYTDELLEREKPANINPLRARQSPHLMAAAGSPISAEVLKEMDDSGIISVQISGLSMEPLLHDGDIIEMRHKSKSRTHFMRKGLIYLVEVDGGYAVKRYNTRPAREDEQDEEYLTPTGSVGVLESINPDFEPIDIKCPVEWVAWLEHAD